MKLITHLFLVSTLIFIYAVYSNCQIGKTIPLDRRVDWQYAGYMHKEIPIPTKYDFEVTVEEYDNLAIKKAIKKAVKHNRQFPNHLTKIYFPPGIYNITRTIELTFTHNNIVLFGAKAGSDPKTCTILKYNSPPPRKDYPLIQIKGKVSSHKYNVVKYESDLKKIFLNKSAPGIEKDDYIEITIPNGDWNDAFNDKVNNWNSVPKDYVGQIVKVIDVNKEKTELILEDDIDLTYSFANNNEPKLIPTIRKIKERPNNIGIQSLTIESGNTFSESEPCGKRTLHINFEYATNCWVKLVGSLNPGTNHIHIGKSAAIEIRDSYFRGAQYHGGCGNAYGVMLWNHATNCLIENNIFRDLRHSVLLQLGANRNVVGYNYSREQHDLLNLNKEDISFHGHFAYANLIEGNYVDRIGVDLYWGKSGPYNTFFRNYSSDHIIKMEWVRNVYDPKSKKLHHKIVGDNRFNILGNEAKILTTINNRTNVSQVAPPSELLDIYGFQDDPNNFPVSQTEWKEDIKVYLPDISYYRKGKPEFYDKSLSWPSIGPPVDIDSKVSEQNIPVRKRYCSWKGSDCN